MGNSNAGQKQMQRQNIQAYNPDSVNYNLVNTVICKSKLDKSRSRDKNKSDPNPVNYNLINTVLSMPG